MGNPADIKLPFCPKCGKELVSLDARPSGVCADFPCGARAFRSYDAGKQFYVWLRTCNSLLSLMNKPGD